MKKKILVLLIALIFTVAASGTAAAMVEWFGNRKSEDNKAVIGTFVKLDYESVSGGDIYEAGGIQVITFKVSKSISDTNDYDLIINGIEFHSESGYDNWIGHLKDVWEYSIGNTDNWVAFTGDDILLASNVNDGTTAVLYLRLKDNSPEDYNRGSLKFTAKLVESGWLENLISVNLIGGSVLEGTHDADKEFSAEFKITKHLNNEGTYNLVVDGIEFYSEDDDINWITHLAEVWEYSINGQDWFALTGAKITLASDVSNGDEASLYLRLKEGAPAEYVAGTLKFAAGLVIYRGGE